MKTANQVLFYLSLAVAVVDMMAHQWMLAVWMIFCAWLNLRALKIREKMEATNESENNDNSVQ